MDCESPCLWGIIPGKTTLNEAINIFVHLGLPIKSTTYEGKEFYGTQYEFDSGLSIIVTLTIQDEIVKNFRVDINPETQKVGVPREWLAYSPETLIRQYGLPSKVDFFLGRGPRTSFTMYMYFDAADLIVEYHILDLRARLQVCPLIEQFHYVGIWMGKDPIYIPAADTVPLEKATSMTMEEFTELMIGTPNKACFNVKGEMFP